MDVNSDLWKYSELTYTLDYDKIVKEDKVYVDYNGTDPIQIENRKAEYPWTGGNGTRLFTMVGIAAMVVAAIGYSRKKKVIRWK